MIYNLQSDNLDIGMCRVHHKQNLTEIVNNRFYVVQTLSPTSIKIKCKKCAYEAIYEEANNNPIKVLL